MGKNIRAVPHAGHSLTQRHMLVAFVLCGAMAGLAGALHGHRVYTTG
jgi:ABC-type uncharacterized transport system permease subunit